MSLIDKIEREKVMKVAFLNLCHCDPMIVERVARKLTASPAFDMYIHVDAKQDEVPFRKRLNDCPRVYFVKNRQKVYWGGYHAVLATLELMRVAVESDVNYDYYVLLQNLDYPLKSNKQIEQFFDSIISNYDVLKRFPNILWAECYVAK